jgi:hypothetical protein
MRIVLMLIAVVVPVLPLAWLWDHNKRDGRSVAG